MPAETRPDKEPCPLCRNLAEAFFKNIYYLCPVCGGIFRPEHLLLSPEREKARYETHNNDVDDVRYQSFVAPIVDAILRDFAPRHRGLDFGAGTGPVISKLLGDQGYQTSLYDPFFHDHPEFLRQHYDYIICCEVIEHFYHPAKEFSLLQSLLKENGKLYCMTELYEPHIDFARWRYQNDETHVFLYQPQTLELIRRNAGFASLNIDDRLIKLTA